MYKEVKRKLKVEEYVFEIDGEDIFDTELTYKFSEMEIGYYEKGIRHTKTESLIEIELNGKSKDKKDARICFELKTDLKYLKSLPVNKIIDITNILSNNESFVKRPNTDYSEFLNFDYPQNNEHDMYMKLTSLLVYKLNDNEFIMKLSVSNEVFTYFKIIFD